MSLYDDLATHDLRKRINVLEAALKKIRKYVDDNSYSALGALVKIDEALKEVDR